MVKGTPKKDRKGKKHKDRDDRVSVSEDSDHGNAGTASAASGSAGTIDTTALRALLREELHPMRATIDSLQSGMAGLEQRLAVLEQQQQRQQNQPRASSLSATSAPSNQRTPGHSRNSSTDSRVHWADSSYKHPRHSQSQSSLLPRHVPEPVLIFSGFPEGCAKSVLVEYITGRISRMGASANEFRVWTPKKYSAICLVEFNIVSEALEAARRWRLEAQYFDTEHRMQVYCKWKVTPERSRVFRRLGSWIITSLPDIERDNGSLTIFHNKQTVARIFRGELLPGKAWPPTLLPASFKQHLADFERESATKRYCL